MPQGPLFATGFNTPFAKLPSHTYASLPSAEIGAMLVITDSTTNTWGAAITVGGGTDKVFAWFNGTNWTVFGK